MSLKWTTCDSGILRKNKSECKEKKEELFVFGYSCKLFRDDDKAIHVDQGKHLIPWMGDETLKIDRYDARGALHDLSNLEAPPGGFDWRVELTKTELEVEQLCDEERYRALHTNEDEEEMYKEEELKRLHAAGYGQVGFNYDTPVETKTQKETVEVEEPFIPTLEFKAILPPDTLLPDTLKQNAIIEKTAKFIASQGTQMEILIKAKQGDNPQFKFLNRDSSLNPYYLALVDLVKAGKWPQKANDVVEEKQQETNDEYLHPSLATTIIESAPSIPSIHYKPSADCDYTMLISKMRCDSVEQSDYNASLAAGEVAPPGTEPVLPARAAAPVPILPAAPLPVLPPKPQPRFEPITAVPVRMETKISPNKSTGLSLMKNYNTDSDSDDLDSEDASSTDSKDKPACVLQPPEEIKIVVDKMAAYVARNGDDFAEIVRAKKDPRFVFLEPDNIYHGYYKKTMREKRGGVNGVDKKGSGVVSFSIKKPKAPDPILPKPALPYESSSDEDDTKAENSEEQKQDKPEPPKSNVPPLYPMNSMPPVVVYKMGVAENHTPVTNVKEQAVINNLKIVSAECNQSTVEQEAGKVEKSLVVEEKSAKVEGEVKTEEKITSEEKPREKEKREASRSRTGDRDSPHRDRRRHKDRKKRYKSKSDSRDSRKPEKTSEKDKKRDRQREKEREERDRYKKRRKAHEVETEVISLEDNSNDLIDLTGDHSDSKADLDSETERVKQIERRRRAAEFLKKVGVDPVAATLPNTSLASAMVDTLESLRKKKAEEEEKRRRREKRHRRERRDYEDSDRHRKSKRSKRYRSSDEDESDCDSPKRRKHKKEKKMSSRSKRRRDDVEVEENIVQLKIDLESTLKELRTTSPTKELGLHIDEDSQTSLARKESTEESEGEAGETGKNEREYSEGEWSSDSAESNTTASK